MNFIHAARAALAAAVLAGGVLGTSVAPTLADAANLQPTQTLFTCSCSTQAPDQAVDIPGTQLSFSGVVSPNASGTVEVFHSEYIQNALQVGYAATVPVTDGQFSFSIATNGDPGGWSVSPSAPLILGAGTHWLIAVYLGNDGLAPSASPVFRQVISSQPVADPYLQPTQTLFTSPSATQAPDEAVDRIGGPLTFTGVVAPNASGTVIMLDFEPDGKSLHVGPVPVADGQFSVSIPTSAGKGIIGAGASLGSGTHWLTAVYLGNEGLAPSSSPVFTEVLGS